MIRTAGAGRRHAGFTLIELLVVIAVLAILAVIVITAVSASLARAKKTTAMSNLRSCRVMLQQYSTKMGRVFEFPRRLTHCSTRYGFTEETAVFLDPADTAKGKSGPFPGNWDSPAQLAWYNKDLGEGMTGSPADELPCSFIFEMADINSSDQGQMMSWMFGSPSPSRWDTNGDSMVSWREYKFYQLRNGDGYSNSYGVDKYPASLFPVLRSAWWATFDYNVDFDQLEPGSSASIASVMCESLEGNYFETTKYWEAYVLRRMGKPVPSSDLGGK